MAVNGVEIQVGQVWCTRGGVKVEVLQKSNSTGCPWLLSSGHTITDRGFVNEEGVYSGYDLVELIQEAPADADSLASEMLTELGWRFNGQSWLPPAPRMPGEQPIGMIDLTPPETDMTEPGYEFLASVLRRAYNQAAIGKGKERHANGESFEEQVMQDGARRFGVGSLLFQAFKKSEESQRLPLERGVNELLGAIVYLAGAVIRRELDAAEGSQS